MGTTFEELFKHAYMHSYGATFQALKESLAYQERSAKCEAAYNALCAKLGEDKKLLEDYDENNNAVGSIESEYVYRQGARDCVYLCRWLGLIQ